MGHKNSKHDPGKGDNSNNGNGNNINNINNNNNNNNINTNSNGNSTNNSININSNNNINYEEHDPVTQADFEGHLRRFQEHTDPPDSQAVGNWLYPPSNSTCKPPNYLQPRSKEFDHDIKLLLSVDFLDNRDLVKYVHKELLQNDHATHHEDGRCVGALGRKINITFVGAEWWRSLGAMYNSRDPRAATLRNGNFHAAIVVTTLEHNKYLGPLIQEYVRYKKFPQFIVVLVIHTENITQEDKDNFYNLENMDFHREDFLKNCVVVRFVKIDPSKSQNTGEIGPLDTEICKLVHFLIMYVKPTTKPKQLHTITTSEACTMSGDFTNKESEVKRQYAADPAEIIEERAKLQAALQDRSKINAPELEKLIVEFPNWLTRPIDPAKRTFLHLICHYAKKENEEELQKPVEYLLSHGAEINAQDIQGNTPLHFACSNGLAKLAQTLVQQKGINLNIKDLDSASTPIMHACYGLQLDAIPVLVAAGADVRIPNVYGFTPMQYIRARALEEHNPKFEQILSALGFPDSINFPGTD